MINTNPIFVKGNSTSNNAGAVLGTWKSAFDKKANKSNIKDKNLSAAQSITDQSLASLNSNEKHGHIWVAKRNEKVCAVLLADDSKDGLIIRFLVSNVRDPEAKGSGIFLVNNMLELANKTEKTVRLIPENSIKFWRDKMGFEQDLQDALQYVYTPTAISVPNRKTRK